MADTELAVNEAPDSLEVEIVDDTPEQDRDRKPLSEAPEPTDDELEEYSEKVKGRMAKLTHGYHDERRAKETAQRERDEAVSIARQLHTDRQRLLQQYQTGEQAYVSQYKEKADMSLSAAKRLYKEAYEAGDAEAMATAQEQIAAATWDQKQASTWAAQKSVAQPVQAEYSPPQPPQVTAPKPDQKTLSWVDKNTWFGNETEMTAFAYGVHDTLTRAGVDPNSEPDEYYARIDKRMREKFPEYQWGDPKQHRPASVVAPVQRTSNRTAKVVLTQSQVSLANRLGLSPEQYARELAKLENRNG